MHDFAEENEQPYVGFLSRRLDLQEAGHTISWAQPRH